jgi:catechol 2,3-dioxygenase
MGDTMTNATNSATSNQAGEPSVTEAGKLHPATRLGAVHLTVSELDRAVAFYTDVLGFQVHDRAGEKAYLGAGRQPFLVLTEVRGARHWRNRSGLYHFAILTPSRLALAQSLRRLVETGTPIGGGDHLVSEAIYLSDPDGNGIEVYRDRPRSTWAYEHGEIKMDTIPLDFRGILAELDGSHAPWQGLAPDTSLGHMHLHVGDLAAAGKFYTDVVGFDFMLNYGGSALFFSAGGYHHHLGVNTWAGAGAPPPPADAVGLRYFEVQLADAAEGAGLLQRLEAAGVSYEVQGRDLLVRDPAQNGLLFLSA